METGIQKMEISICKDCYERMRHERELENKNIEFSYTFDGDQCSLCGKMSFFNTIDAFVYVPVIVDIQEVELCNCGDFIKHNDGGNYHYCRGKIIKVIYPQEIKIEEEKERKGENTEELEILEEIKED